MKRYQVLRDHEGDAANVGTSALGFGTLVVDTFDENRVKFMTDAEYAKARERGEVE